jgi:lipid-binding SYLF domain-containing protein
MLARYLPRIVVALALCTIVLGCSTAPKTNGERDALAQEADAALTKMKTEDPTLTEFMSDSYGHAIFPNVGKGGLIVGGAYGRGVVYEQGKLIGYADLTQASVGAQVGGQAYTELLVFENKAALDNFISGKLDFGASASAVAVKSGASAAASYKEGVAVFTKPISGLMAEAAIGGQDFSYVPKGSAAATTAPSK